MKINILHIGTSGGRGGVESFILNTCKHVDREKYNLTLLADCETAVVDPDFRALGGEVIYIPPIAKDKKGYLKGLWRTIDKKKYDVVHIHKNSLSNPFPVFICRMKGIKKIILHSHNTMPTNPDASTKVHDLSKKLLGGFRLKRLACSELAAKWMFGEGYKKKNVEIVSNGIEVEKYRYNSEVRDRVRSELGLEGKYVFGHVGRFAEQKNHKFLLDIFKAYSDENAVLLLVGIGPLQDSMKEYATTLGIDSRVRFLGIRHDINELMQAMDMFLFPSIYEGLGIVAIEAQAAGLPVIASDKVPDEAGITDIISFLPLDSTDVWCKEINRLRNSYVRRDTMEEIKAAGYDIRDTAARLDGVYQSK